MSDRLHPAEEEGIVRSLPTEVTTRIYFLNLSSGTRRVYWLDHQGRRTFYRELRPDEGYLQLTYVTHPWLITDAQDDALALYFPDAQPRVIVLQDDRQQ